MNCHTPVISIMPVADSCLLVKYRVNGASLAEFTDAVVNLPTLDSLVCEKYVLLKNEDETTNDDDRIAEANLVFVIKLHGTASVVALHQGEGHYLVVATRDGAEAEGEDIITP